MSPPELQRNQLGSYLCPSCHCHRTFGDRTTVHLHLAAVHYVELVHKIADLLDTCETAADDLLAMEVRNFMPSTAPRWIGDIRSHLLRAIATVKGR
jgi:hypothetical protein